MLFENHLLNLIGWPASVHLASIKGIYSYYLCSICTISKLDTAFISTTHTHARGLKSQLGTIVGNCCSLDTWFLYNYLCMPIIYLPIYIVHTLYRGRYFILTTRINVLKVSIPKYNYIAIKNMYSCTFGLLSYSMYTFYDIKTRYNAFTFILLVYCLKQQWKRF